MTGKVWSYIAEKLEREGALHFSLLDPDPFKVTPGSCAEMAKLAEDAGTDAIRIGGSTAFGIIDDAVKAISDAVEIPTILFPGNISGVSKHADAMFFMSLLNSTNPYWIIGAQALAAANVKLMGIEPISMGYLLISPGKTAAWVGDAKVFPRDKPRLPLMYALAAELLGFKLVYLEAGSGAEGGGVPVEMISAVTEIADIPVVTGGGFNDAESVAKAVEAGASIVVQGTYLEKTLSKDKGAGLKKIIKALKEAGAKRVKK
ncbi:MAG: geranylgeranylglyceryl/heptaprenylglyceryl phosphate synthase [Candidatus Thorarchaeota archaeon]|nr:MAG: geranylgeranylglyceryl/heptaprenylglyceryl phosphate synthase [Candidatus Thorarchaeota archaeon]